ncbi:TAXI family TRAP transporter solute-binding subunit [Pelagibius litoralis]|uniref:TAXI family TRAP transporter solute-binding subunit n=1 Tax=Pelagibius litoralis TaxID=374515 RepID=A0A967K810_9PROT|nr:TAXI family TRAP transporter solute-binding subunit [Pelagibius litoralis]NIA70168.1 TAXI family TRAP transporter solute-binding subunit [Pelagibius litoralis]
MPEGIYKSGLKGLCISLTLACLTGQPGTAAWAADKAVTIGTGSRAGVYYQVGRAVCRLVNQSQAQHGIACNAPSTAGSISNLKAVRAGQLQLAVAQSDWQFHAVNGSSRFSSAKPDPDLRSVFSVHGEPFTLVVRRDSGIRHLRDIEGRRVNIGNPGSGQRGTMEVVMQAMGWTKSSFSLSEELPASQQSLALCHDRVQALVYTVGHPNDSVAQAVRLCDAVIAEVSGPEIEKLVAARPYYAFTTVPGGLYSGNRDDVTTFGVKATLVTSAKVDADTIYAVTKAVFENLDSFRRMHPAFAGLQPERMVRDGLSAPLHEGAARYFKERGWL